MEKELDYVYVLKAVEELPFNVGKQLLFSVLTGRESAESVLKNKLHKLSCFGVFAYSKNEVYDMVDMLVQNKFLNHKMYPNKGWRVLELTEKGRKEIKNPSFHKKQVKIKSTQITDKDRQIFELFGPALKGLNNEQKKALISTNNKILCIAGAGSGKTTVLTKRIKFLIHYRSVDPSKILAITFTRKARQEMMKRLAGFNVRIETFNSFCERILRENEDLLYDKKQVVLDYKKRYKLVALALNNLNIETSTAMDTYFSRGRKNSKTKEELISIFVHDCFFIRDYFKTKRKPIEDFSADASLKNKDSARMMYKVCKFIDEKMKKQGLRDFSDQVVDTINLFIKHKDKVPLFEHVLVDEYQDVNSMQVKLLELLDPKNLFCVGDPRQSIFGWRGSDIGYICDFDKKYPDCEIISLTTNYRSNKHIVKLANKAIKHMKLPDLKSSYDGKKNIEFHDFSTEDEEYSFIAEKIKKLNVPNHEIFVLARTNRQLKEMSYLFSARKIKHVVRSDELRRLVLARKGEVTLSTIHAIKGMEAECVFIAGCTPSNFPCRASEHPVVELIKLEEYDKYDEERRLFYVALSRAKNHLVLSYSGKTPTYFLTKDILSLMNEKQTRLAPLSSNSHNSQKLFSKLRRWRLELSREYDIAPYKIFTDKTLLEICQAKPLTRMDLRSINGVGPVKINRYGSAILEMVANYE
ncbi:MAG: ATP-dependent DNA helicase Rep [Candidatus Woesearchaeota archaeon]|nr:ATP-dependent DNA helicase Rep [Candidatus Woesearchaeota archaeon]